LPHPVPLRAAVAIAALLTASAAEASDHLDTPSVIADPRADIGDLFAWTSPDGTKLELVMTIVGHAFSDRLTYAFHVDSGRVFSRTSATATIACRFPAPDQADCRIDGADRAQGDAGAEAGLAGRNHRFRVFAGVRDDPFFNNVRGTRAAYQAATTALAAGVPSDAAGCPAFSAVTSAAILDEWRHTDGGPGRNFLAGWTPAAIVVEVELPLVAKGGPLLGVWASTASAERQIDRAGRPLTGNALLGTLATADESDRLKEAWNAATPADGPRFAPEIGKWLGLYDAFDGQCGNQLLAEPGPVSANRYRSMAALLADDRLWVNSASHECGQFFAVELAALAGRFDLERDCGGRTPLTSAANVWRSLLVDATVGSVDDGVSRDEREHSVSIFPFLAAPTPGAPLKP
jgi:hypothetical protein